jgi:NAD(P)H-hydrate epimerase
MKILTAAEMREVDRRTIESGIPGIVLMENAGLRVVEFLAERFAPLSAQRIVVLCGKGNNGGDGLVVARQLLTRLHPAALHTVLIAPPEDLKGDAAANYRMLIAAGGNVLREFPPEARCATLVIDALLGTGLTGPASGVMLQAVQEINRGFPLAKVVAVDLPSGMPSDSGSPLGDCARADFTVTFTAPKIAHAFPPNCDLTGELIVAPIGSPASLYEDVNLSLNHPTQWAAILAPRIPAGHKGTYGHALIIAGSRGKTGAAAMSGIAALRSGAGLVTVASAQSAIAEISAHAPELMTEPLRETESGLIALNAGLPEHAKGMTVVAIGPGLGRAPHIAPMVNALAEAFEGPLILDADALLGNVDGAPGRVRILTPHPGEMSRLTGLSTAEVQANRLNVARHYASKHSVMLVLKGQRTLIAFPDGRVVVNPTGTPAMGTGGTGDILTGMIAGLVAQFPETPDQAVAAAVYLHGFAGQLAARALGEKSMIATDILQYLPCAMEECAHLSHVL